ncbi:iron complex outermembrane receptor protein [Litorimonas taeanensis]|uniref:Iron complex outermembrane receptor protein n=1 Tax=Litorimonas taeanensis TaxID=568099 RepID=A0A420WEW6_9PROT|nr:TonB-dependent receptor [Litorimonas taeanensis]RKQ69530.1 iron complex outermembrane receptor protein [Litorimonas taeanensis]
MNKQTALSASLSVLAASLLMSPSAQAQNRQSAIDVLTDEIVVTATKKTDAEGIQDVPIAITAFSGGTLEALKVRTLEDLSYSAPNVALDDIGTSRGGANFSIRGLGVNSSIPSIDPTVGLFVDGVYMGVTSGVLFDVFDLDSVEVLRGPQGILFGRNTTGGAVLLNTGDPTDELEYSLRYAVDGPVDSGRGGVNVYGQGVISGPLIKDKLNGKLGVYYNNDAGYFKNVETGNNVGQQETYILRAGLEFTPSENIRFLAKGDYFNNKGQGPVGQNRGLYERDSFDFAIDNEGSQTGETYFGVLKTEIDVDFGDGRITNIFGYRDAVGTTNGDIDSTPLNLFHSTTDFAQDQISNELRYNGTFGRADVTTGVFYFDQDVAYTETRELQRALTPTPLPIFYGGGYQAHSVFGLFGAVDYSLTEALKLQLGIRYSEEEKDAGITYIQARNPCSVVEGTCPVTGTNMDVPGFLGGGLNNGFTDSDKWSNWSPKVGLQYLPNENSQVFANWTRGYRSGGYNFRITNPAAFEGFFPPGSDRATREEKVDSYEIGTKIEFADRRAQLNGSVFVTKINDMQRELNLSDPVRGVLQNIINTADATIKGVEIEGRLKATDNLLFTGNIGIIDGDYDTILNDISGDGIVDDTDLALDIPRLAPLTFGAGVIHDMDMGDSGTVTSRLNFQRREEFAYTDTNFGFIQAADILDANITWNTPLEGVAISIFGKNLLDEVQAGNDTQLPFGGNLAGFIPGATNLANGVNSPYDNAPAVGTLSPLKKGRRLGIELTIKG